MKTLRELIRDKIKECSPSLDGNTTIPRILEEIALETADAISIDKKDPSESIEGSNYQDAVDIQRVRRERFFSPNKFRIDVIPDSSVPDDEIRIGNTRIKNLGE